jgi:antitoxin component YwqK of YwqJK toxin-antitoxin module
MLVRLAVIALLFLAGACSKRTVALTYWGDDSTASSITRVDGVLEGPYLLFHPGGARHIEMTYRRGLRHGTYSAWYPDGQRLARGAYDNGLRVGEWEEWSAEGLPRSKGAYRAGDKDGVWKVYDDEGKLEFEETWVSSRRIRRDQK